MNNWFDRDGRLARVLIYLAKLTLFLAVPGIHLICTRKLAIGYFILVSIIVGALVVALPIHEANQISFALLLIWFLYLILTYLISVTFIAFDTKSLVRSNLNNSTLILAFSALLVVF